MKSKTKMQRVLDDPLTMPPKQKTITLNQKLKSCNFLQTMRIHPGSEPHNTDMQIKPPCCDRLKPTKYIFY